MLADALAAAGALLGRTPACILGRRLARQAAQLLQHTLMWGAWGVAARAGAMAACRRPAPDSPRSRSTPPSGPAPALSVAVCLDILASDPRNPLARRPLRVPLGASLLHEADRTSCRRVKTRCSAPPPPPPPPGLPGLPRLCNAPCLATRGGSRCPTGLSFSCSSCLARSHTPRRRPPPPPIRLRDMDQRKRSRGALGHFG